MISENGFDARGALDLRNNRTHVPGEGLEPMASM
jgi:hypothetical protein